MRLVYKKRINAERFKVHVVLVNTLDFQTFQLRFQLGNLLFHLLDGEAPFSVLRLFLGNRSQNLIDLLLEESLLVFLGHRDFTELLIREDHRIKISVGDVVGEYLPVLLAEAFVICHKELCRREIAVEFYAPLSNKAFRNSKYGLFHNAKLSQLHGSRRHFQGLSSANPVGKQGIASGCNNPLHSVCLVLPQGKGCVEAIHRQAGTIIFRVSQGVIGLIVELRQLCPPFFVAPYPVLEFLFDFIRLFLGRSGLVLIDNPAFFSVGINLPVSDRHVSVPEQGFKKIKEAFAAGSPFLGVVVVSFQPGVIQADFVFSCLCRVANLHIRATISVVSSAEHMGDEICIHIRWYPHRTGGNMDFVIRNVLRDHPAKLLHIVLEVPVVPDQCFRLPQLCPHVAGKVGFRCFQSATSGLEGHSAVNQFPGDFLLTPAGEPGNQGGIHTAGGIDGHDQTVADTLRMGDGDICLNGVLCEDVRLFRCGRFSFPALLVIRFQGEQRKTIRVFFKGFFVLRVIDKPVFLHKGIVNLIQIFPGLRDFFLRPALLNPLHQIPVGIPDVDHTADSLCGVRICHGNAGAIGDGSILCPAVCAILWLSDRFLRCLLDAIGRFLDVIHFPGNLVKGRANLVSKAPCVLQRGIGNRFSAVHSTGNSLFPKHHFRVSGKVFVHICHSPASRDALLRCFQERLAGIRSTGNPFFQNQDVRHNVRSSVPFEGGIR